jgi:hypothetical protein
VPDNKADAVPCERLPFFLYCRVFCKAVGDTIGVQVAVLEFCALPISRPARMPALLFAMVFFKA